MTVLQSSGFIKLEGSVDVDGFFVGGFEEGKVGRSKGRKRQMVMGIQIQKKGLVRCHAVQVNDCGTKQLNLFLESIYLKKQK